MYEPKVDNLVSIFTKSLAKVWSLLITWRTLNLNPNQLAKSLMIKIAPIHSGRSDGKVSSYNVSSKPNSLFTAKEPISASLSKIMIPFLSLLSKVSWQYGVNSL